MVSQKLSNRSSNLAPTQTNLVRRKSLAFLVGPQNDWLDLKAKGLKKSDELQQGEGRPDYSPLNSESQNKIRKSPLVLLAADNQLETLEVDSEPQLSFAFHYSWSDPSLDYEINSLTGVLPPIDNSIDNGPSMVPETNIQKPMFDNTVTRRRRDNQNNSIDNEPTIVHETDTKKNID